MPKLARESSSGIRIKFFELIFGDTEGIFCFATSDSVAPKTTWKQYFFDWPNEVFEVEHEILKLERNLNVYFCVNLLNKRERKKENCLPTGLLWADLDDVDPMTLKVPPPIVIQSSPGRYQALWRLSTELPPLQAEEYSRRIAYAIGADKSGWDLTQMLRVPFTRNFKYEDNPPIQLLSASEITAPPLIFEGLPSSDSPPDYAMPEQLPIVEQVIYKYAAKLRGTPFTAIYSQEPTAEQDWSNILWRLIHILFEAGMSPEEVFSVAKQAPCNKYARDGRPDVHLWKDILKAGKAQENLMLLTSNFKPLLMPHLVDAPASDTFIDTYRNWAAEATDAIVAFHDLSCTIMLSAIVSNSVRLDTTYGQIVPNLWGLILGESTLTRKTTAMKMIVDLLNQVDPNMIVATDGSPEGLLTGLETRPNKVSIFYKDEVSGFFDSINKKDYLSGMPEILTALYDVPPVYTRLLRKTRIRIEQPAFIFFGGGIPNRVYDNITEEYIISGFLPRFLVVSGEADLAKLRRTGPPTEVGSGKRAAILSDIADMFEWYGVEVHTKIGGQPMDLPQRHKAELTQKAWTEYGRIEDIMVQEASESAYPDTALPTFERMSRSVLKMGIVLGASRQKPKEGKPLQITDKDIINAAWYIQDWGRFSVELVANAGKRASEKMLEKILRIIEKNPGVLRSQITRHHHLSKKEADEIFQTLEDRQLVIKEQQGRGFRYFLS